MSKAVERGCGVREPGGTYLETTVHTVPASGKTPVEPWINPYLLDPPVPVPARMELPNRGVMLFPRDEGRTVFDVYDRVGEKSYPNVVDFVRETLELGLSRRIPTTVDFSLLTPGSRIYLAHPRSILTNAAELYKALAEEMHTYLHRPEWKCRCNVDPHRSLAWLFGNGETCVSCWWELITGGEPTFDPDHFPRTVERVIGKLKYLGRKAPEGFNPEYQDGFFLRLPVHKLAVINDPSQGKHEEAFERASESSLPVTIEDA